MVKGKSGKLNALMIFVLLFLGVVAIIMLGIFVFGANLVDSTFNIIGDDVQIGDINFSTAYDNTLGQGITAFQNGADSYGLGLLLGMVLLMAISSFVFREKQKIWIVLELGILLVAFVFAVSIQNTFNILINSSPQLLDIYSNDLIRSSKFILNLPTIVPVVWAFVVVISYGLFRKKEEGLSDLGA